MTIEQGIAHQQAGRLAEAESVYRGILSQQPDHADALHLLGLVWSQAGDFQKSAELIQQAIAVNPSAAHFHCNLAQAFAGVGRFDDAIAAARRAIQLRPDYPQALNNLGSALDSAGRSDEAIGVLQKALNLLPNFPQACNNLGNALRKVGRVSESIAMLGRSLELRRDDPLVLNNLGTALRADKQVDQAIAVFQKAIALRPDYPEAHNNLGNALRDKGFTAQAIAEFHAALRLEPALAEAHNNLAGALEELGNQSEAIAAYRQAIQIAPQNVTAHINLGIALLRQENFSEGWKEYEWRLKTEELSENLRAFSKPRWDGAALSDRKIILHAEQGFGDTIQFVRYATVLADRGAEVILQCQPELVELMKSVTGIARVIPVGEPLPDYDMHSPLLSLPGILGNLQGPSAYLRADEQKVSRWRERLAKFPGRKIGLVWAGRPEQSRDRTRSTTLAALAPLAEISDVCFFSLQKGAAAAQLCNVPSGLKLIDLVNELHDFSETAAAMENLDLVISVDTAPAHLAGALGRPVWVMLSYSADWRYFLDQDDSPFYPTMRLFRQTRINDWDGVVRRVVDALLL